MSGCQVITQAEVMTCKVTRNISVGARRTRAREATKNYRVPREAFPFGNYLVLTTCVRINGQAGYVFANSRARRNKGPTEGGSCRTDGIEIRTLRGSPKSERVYTY